MRAVEYDNLSDDVQKMIAELQVKVHDLEYESNFYRWASAIVFLLVIERIWDRWF
jgi:hypothetical protein